MGSVICVLKDDVINKIAAGEVVENPASVVKELVENSLDAGATDISVEIKGGGRQLIRVTDNGVGMSPDDALLSVKRHATSKIANIDDLNQLNTMGFRGEAIASIASISKLTLITGQGGGSGTLVFVDGGKVVKHAPVAASQGTVIEVKSLFFNVPVRKKFQKSPARDSAEIFKIVSMMALGNPGVKFQLIRDGETALEASVSAGSFDKQLQERISSVLSRDFLTSCLPLKSENIEGFVGSPSTTRHNRLGQYLFINRRCVISPQISRAVREGYGTTIAPQRYPVFVLHMTMPGFDVDVNVHPQKREVRLRDEESVVGLVREAVSQALRKKEAKMVSVSPRFTSYTPNFEPVSKVEETVSAYSVPLEVSHPEFDFAETAGETEHLRVIYTLPGYILVEKGGELLIIDQRRAHHRVLFDKLTETKGCPSERLLIPQNIELTKIETETLRESLSLLKSLGFEIREFGPQVFVIDSIPPSFSNKDIPSMIRESLEDLREFPALSVAQKAALAAKISLKGAVSSRARLGQVEAEMLVKDLWKTTSPDQSPKGKNIWTAATPEAIGGLL